MAEKTGKYGKLIQQAKASEKQEAEAKETLENEPVVSLTIKVPKAYRQHWQAEAKRSGSSITADITEALIQKYGLPE